ncbi:MAG: hypothetical protein II649_06960 [Kiritimatiellae bacterium]|nr:hypothetical protein [Kiritimatiellia bacterium]
MNLKADNEIEKRVFEYILANASPNLMARISAEGKTIQGCWKFVTSYARKHAANNQYCMPDEEAFGLVMHYFEDEPEGATYKTDEEKQAEEDAKKSAEEREAEAKRREEERLAALTPEEREAEVRAKAEAEAERKRIKAEAEAKREAEEAERRKKELERKIREQAKREAEERKRKLAEAQQTFDF